MLTGLPLSVSRLTACGSLRSVALSEPQAKSFIELHAPTDKKKSS